MMDACVLVVDDTEINLTLVKTLLENTGIGIDTAISGKDAVRMAGEKKYDVIFIDHMMPDMDGIETLSRIRACGESKDAPAVALTANAISGARKMYLDAGFTDYLPKPVDGTKLKRMLADLLPDNTHTGDTKEPLLYGTQTSSDLIGHLSSIPEIDVSAGIKNCGSEEGYRSVLMVFHQTAGAKADEIKEYYRRRDMENFAVKVHALKSSARIIGAGKLSDLAKTLEDAARHEDTEYVIGNTERLLKMYRNLDDKLLWLDRVDDKLPEISAKSLKEAWQTIGEIAEVMDYGMMEDMLGFL